MKTCSVVALMLAFAGAAFAAAANPPADKKPMPKRPSAAELAQRLANETQKYTDQINALNRVLKPYDFRADQLQRESADDAARASTLTAQADQLQRAHQPVADPMPQARAIAANLSGVANAILNVRQLLGQYAGSQPQMIDNVLAQVGVNLPAIANAIESSSRAIAVGNTPERVQSEIAQLQNSPRAFLEDARNRFESARATYEQRFRSRDGEVANQQGQIRYWEAQRGKHQQEADAAYARCQKAKFYIGNVEFTTDAGAWAAYGVAQAGIAQANAAIDLANSEIGLIEVARLPDSVGAGVAHMAVAAIDDYLHGMDQQIGSLREVQSALVARRDNQGAEKVAEQKRAEAANLSAEAAKLRAAAGNVYATVQDKVTLRATLTRQRAALRTHFGGNRGGAQG